MVMAVHTDLILNISFAIHFFGLEVNIVLIGKGGGMKRKHLGLYKSALSVIGVTGD